MVQPPHFPVSPFGQFPCLPVACECPTWAKDSEGLFAGYGEGPAGARENTEDRTCCENWIPNGNGNMRERENCAPF